MKKFAWQHKNEKVLYFSRENIFSYIMREFNFIFIILWILLFIVFFTYFFQFQKIILFIIVILYILISLSLFWFFWAKTFFIITNKRVMKYIRNWLFSHHTKELKIDQINELTITKPWMIAKLLNFWNIKIVWKDKEAVIWIKWLSYNDEVVQYVSRLKDYFLENPWYDCKKLVPFKLRKERKKLN